MFCGSGFGELWFCGSWFFGKLGLRNWFLGIAVWWKLVLGNPGFVESWVWESLFHGSGFGRKLVLGSGIRVWETGFWHLDSGIDVLRIMVLGNWFWKLMFCGSGFG